MNNTAKKLNRFPNQFKFTGYQSLLNLNDLGNHGIFKILKLAKDIKANPNAYSNVMHGKRALASYQRSSSRTYCSFDVTIKELGGIATTLQIDETLLKGKGSVDEALALSALYDLLVIKASSHYDLIQIQKSSFVPVINAVSDLFYPCQVLADLLTLSELYEDLADVKITYVGIGHNICNSLVNAAKICGINLTVSTPEKYMPYTINKTLLERHGNIKYVKDPKAAVEDADVVYTDNWIPEGLEKETQERANAFSAYQVNAQLLKFASQDVNIFHCMPIYRDYEITDEVLNEHLPTILSQFRNRVPVQKAIVCKLLRLV